MKIPSKTTKKGPFGKESRFLWVRLPWHQILVSTPWHTSRKYQNILLSLMRGTYQAVTIDLTALTLPELLAFREAVLIATEVAEPIVRALDQEAKDKIEDDDSDDRVYRGLPTVIVRKGTLGQYDQSVLLGRADVLRAVGAQILPGQLAPELSGGLDQQDEEGSGSPHDETSDGEPA